MGRATKLIFLAVFILGPAARGFAQTDQNSGTPDGHGGWVIAAYVGGARTAASSLAVAQPALGTSLTFEGVRFRSGSFDPPLYYGLRGGYFIRRAPPLGVEAEFIHLKVFSNPRQRVRVTGLRRGAALRGELPLGEIVQQYSISHGVNLLLFNVAARRGMGRNADAPGGRLILTGRAGSPRTRRPYCRQVGQGV